MTIAFGSPALSRTSDLLTSKEAASQVKTTKLEEMVYDAIKSFGFRGATCDDVRSVLPHVRYDSVNPRFAPLERKGLIKDIGVTRQGTSTRNQRVFIAL